MKDEVKELYKEFIKDGAFFICSLLVERRPKESDESSGGMFSWKELLELQADESDSLQWRKELLEFFSCSEEVKHFHAALVSAVHLLKTLDTGRKRKDYQSIYSMLILETYAKGQALSQVFPYDSTKGAGTVRYDRIRKVALNILVDDIIAENSVKGYLDYDFESEEAVKILEELTQKVKTSHDEDVLRQTKKIFRRLDSHSISGKFGDSASMLMEVIDENYISGTLKRLDTKIIEKKRAGAEQPENNYCAITAETVSYTSTYMLFIDGRLADVGQRPYFDRKFIKTNEKGRDVFRKYRREDLAVHKISIYAGPGPETLKTRVYSESGFDVAEADKQPYCRRYTLKVNDVELDSKKTPYFKKYEEGSFAGRKVEIIAKRDLNELYLMLEAARKYGANNLLLDYTDSERNILTNRYSVTLLANGSLDVIRRISPENYKKIKAVIDGAKNAEIKNLWPLACIYTLC